jgi:hypothetical protein
MKEIMGKGTYWYGLNPMQITEILTARLLKQ